MSEISRCMDTSVDVNKLGPDYFTYYTCQVKDLLSQDEDFVPSAMEVIEKRSGESGKDMIENGSNGPLLSNSVGVGLSDYKKERLNALLRQAVSTLTAEVDEMLDSVTKMCLLKSEYSRRKFGSENIVADGDAEQITSKKLKTSSSSSSTSNTAHASPVSSGSCREGSNTCVEEGKEEDENDLQFLLASDSLVVDHAIKKYSDELLATLGHMEKQLEELLDTVVSTCRPMSIAEKKELPKLIKKLPPKNLSHVAEVVQRGKPVGMQNCDEIFVNLDQQDNVTLHRLYYYVEAVDKARELLFVVP